MTLIPAMAAKSTLPARAPRLRRDDCEFLPAALEILETPLSPIRSAIIMTICGFAASALAWSYMGRVDIIASAQGKIQPVGQTKTIQPLETGKILRIDVADGQHVRAGDTVIEFDTAEARADEATLQADLYAVRAEAVRRRLALAAAARRAVVPPPVDAWTDIPDAVAQRQERVLIGDLAQLASSVASLDAQQSQKLAERDRLKGTILAQQHLLDTLKIRVDMRTELLARNAESKASVIDAREGYETQQTNLASQQGQLGETEASLEVARRDIEKAYAAFTAENGQRLADAERLIDEDDQKLAKAKLRSAHMVLKSPIDGTVQGLIATTVGQVVESGAQLMQVVPDRPVLEIEAYLPNGDIGFIKTGQSAIAKVESFPFTDYGTINAKVTRIAQDAIPLVDADQQEQNPIQSHKATMFGGAQRTQNLVYPVTLELDRPTIAVEGKDVRLSPGMSVTVEVKTGSRRILSYVFSPLVDVVSSAMRER